MTVPNVNPAEWQAAELIHQTNVQHSLERRLQIAREQGNHELVRLLEEEQQQLLNEAVEPPDHQEQVELQQLEVVAERYFSDLPD